MSLLLLGGCLPKTALLEQENLPADRYELAATITVQTTGRTVPTFTYRLAAMMDLSWGHQYRDGSVGRLVDFEQVKTHVDDVDVPNILEGLIMEIRGFDHGEVLALKGVDAGIGVRGHLEILDLIWPSLAPHLEISGNQAKILTSWPVGESLLLGRASLNAQGDWRAHQTQLSGDLSQQGDLVQRHGQLTAHLEFDKNGSRLEHAQWQGIVSVQPSYLDGVTQQQTLDLKLSYLGSTHALPIEKQTVFGDALADANPIVLKDGRQLQHPALMAHEQLPFLILPDQWGADQRALILGE